jgi:hypothetical protein
MDQYENIFKEMHTVEKSRLERIKTDILSPEQVVEQVIQIIERKTGLSLKKSVKIPINQAKLTNWLK